MIWGGQRLGEVLGQPLPTDEPHGEAWILSDHALHRSVVANGPWAGRSLRDLMEHERSTLLGPAAETHPVFPWLVKFLDANDWLSVQVHPDDGQAQALWPGEGGKTEAWFILDTSPGSRIYAGLKPGVSRAQLLLALQSGKVVDCLHSFEPRPGDCVFLPAGTVHAVGGGVLMAEVQQTSDATFRLYDWDRVDASGKPRTLHIEPGMACIDLKRGPVEPIRVKGPGRQALVRCPFFALDRQEERSPFTWGGEGKLQAIVALQGRGRLTTGEAVAPGQCWLLPAALPPVECRPEPSLTLLVSTLG